MNDIRILRDRLDALEDRLDALAAGGPQDATLSVLCTTTVETTYPSGSLQFFACNPVVTAGGTEQEGGTATCNADTTTTIYVANLTTSQPPVGSRVVAHSLGGRWFMSYGGTSHAWCQLSASLGPATGTWPSLTPTTTTADVWQVDDTGAFSRVATGATINNWRNVTWSSGKTTFLMANPDGTYDAIDQDC